MQAIDTSHQRPGSSLLKIYLQGVATTDEPGNSPWLQLKSWLQSLLVDERLLYRTFTSTCLWPTAAESHVGTDRQRAPPDGWRTRPSDASTSAKNSEKLSTTTSG